MFKAIARYLFGSVNERRLKQYYSKVTLINSFEPTISNLSDEDLKNQTNLFKERLAKGETLDDLLPEAFATVREASKRILGKRHYDVQLIGGMILHEGMIPEMRTGEGKTLVAPLAAYLNALTSKGVHIVTVNDYLASRDAAWMGKIYEFLGLTVGCIIHGLSDEERHYAYHCDITHGTNNEFGFDYLRDNMRYSIDEMVHRSFNFAIVDEIDSILIDEARTPLIISGPTEDNSVLYIKINKIIPILEAEDFEKDEKTKSVTLTDIGTEKIEQLLLKNGLLDEGTTLYDIENVNIVHHINQALKAHKLFSKDIDYMIKDNSLLIIDEFTGRALEGRRYSDGLHQALEAKENLPIQNENQTLASITFQNYFRLYPKLSGMTGTAMTESVEFADIYNLEVIEVPANLKVQRIDEDDEIYRSNEEKYEAIINTIVDCHSRKQPILVGTISIEKSEQLSTLLKKHKIKHNVLNAKYHDQEATFIAQAGREGAVTIATNMAGRGTDIMLGGNPEFLIEALSADLTPKQREKETAKILAQVASEKEIVLAAGGLFVIGSERHESRRIDNQLRGRSGRQGDPGKTKFFLSLEDDLMRIFASERISSILGKLGLKQGEAIFHPMISRALEKAQAKVETRNYEIRKNLLKFDNVSNDQRKVIYEQRIEIMESQESFINLKEMSFELSERLIHSFVPANTYPETWDIERLKHEVLRIYGLDLPFKEWINLDAIDQTQMLDKLKKEIQNLFNYKEEKFTTKLMEISSQRILLLTVDHLWKDHLLSLDHLRQGINLRAYGQKDPLNEYKREAFLIFEQMLENLKELYISRMSHIELSHNQDAEDVESVLPHPKTFETRIDPAFKNKDLPPEAFSGERIGRNDPCPCGSEKKFKQCHGKI